MTKILIKQNKILKEKKGDLKPLLFLNKEKKTIYRVAKPNHFLGKYRGYAIDCDLIDFITKNLGLDFKISIIKENTKELFKSRVKDWLSEAIKVNFGYGDQLVLPVEKMERVKLLD
jgi:hypothetical protein